MTSGGGSSSHAGMGYEPMTLSAEDRLDIADLYARNAWALDLGDVDAFVSTFTADASLQMKQRYVGHERIRHFMALFLDRDFGFPRAQHLVSQLVVEGDGDRARARAYITRVHRLPGQHRGNCHVMWTGYSVDDCVRTGGRWQFSSRALRAWEGDISGSLQTAQDGAAPGGSEA